MIRRLALLSIAAAAALSIAAAPARAVVCSLGLEQAYQAAVQDGWTFRCLAGSALNFDNQKRMGCSGKTLLPRKHKFVAYFFCSNNDDFLNGWRLHSYKVLGGQFTKTGYGGCQVVFSFEVNGAGKHFKRHLSELKLEKSNGSCTNVLEEAF